MINGKDTKMSKHFTMEMVLESLNGRIDFLAKLDFTDNQRGAERNAVRIQELESFLEMVEDYNLMGAKLLLAEAVEKCLRKEEG